VTDLNKQQMKSKNLHHSGHRCYTDVLQTH